MKKKKGDNVSVHVKKQIQHFNTNHAKRPTDVIDVHSKKAAKVKGRGAYQRCLPTTLQRICWGGRSSGRKSRQTRILVCVMFRSASSVVACSLLRLMLDVPIFELGVSVLVPQPPFGPPHRSCPRPLGSAYYYSVA